jgi:hypothetical protein
MQEWDPIGVAGIPEAADEYDAYGAKAYVMLMDEQASEQAIAAYLFEEDGNLTSGGNCETRPVHIYTGRTVTPWRHIKRISRSVPRSASWMLCASRNSSELGSIITS